MTRKTLSGLTLAAAVAVVAVSASFGSSRRSAPAGVASGGHLTYTDDDGVAINGFDPVAYFTDSRPTPGDEQYETVWRGVTWRFSSAENLATFEGDPERYAPAYGGYCAWGIGAQNKLFPIDPDAWRIVDGVLYLNYNADIQQKWLADIPGFIRSADANWPDLARANAG